MTDAVSPAAAPERVGLFGGAFDPPHDGHVALARAFVAQCGLQRLVVVPTGGAHHKRRLLSAGAHRLAMARLAFDGVPGAVVDAIELVRGGPSYSVDTLSALCQRHPRALLYLLIGQDQAEVFDTWRDMPGILRLATIVIARRAMTAPPSSQNPFENQTGASPWPWLQDQAAARWQWLQTPPLPISSTQVRARAARQQRLAGWVPDTVARYIEQHHLYDNH